MRGTFWTFFGEPFSGSLATGCGNEDLRVLLMHRVKQVRLRTRLKNQLDGLAKSEGYLSPRVWSAGRQAELQALPLRGWLDRRRQDLLELHEELDERIAPLDEALREAANQDAAARLLMTHPGVGPGGLAGFCADDWRCEPLCAGQAGGQLFGLDSQRGVQRSAPASGRRKQAGQQPGSLAAGAGGKPGAEFGCELAPAVYAAVNEQASWRGQGGHRA